MIANETSFACLPAGLSNAKIGNELYISGTTVKTHVTHILQKLDLRDRVEAVVLPHQTGLFERDDVRASECELLAASGRLSSDMRAMGG